jgi:hypothetical protein
MTDLIQRLRLMSFVICQEAADEIERITAERDAALADAERYRWLANDCDGNAQDDFSRWLAGVVASKTVIDAAIDAAREKT